MAVNMAKAHAEVVPATVWDEADIGLWWTGHGDITVRLVRAIAVARAAEPILNSWYDGQAMTLRTFEQIDLGIAVDFEGGLIVPVVRDAAARDAASLRAEIDRLKAAVRARAVSVADLRDPTITLSNFGMLAGRQAALVVVPPQVAIIGAGRIFQQAVPGAGTVAFTPCSAVVADLRPPRRHRRRGRPVLTGDDRRLAAIQLTGEGPAEGRRADRYRRPA